MFLKARLYYLVIVSHIECSSQWNRIFNRLHKGITDMKNNDFINIMKTFHTLLHSTAKSFSIMHINDSK